LHAGINPHNAPEPIVEALWWHRQYGDDIAHAWLRRLFVEACRRL
jgi:hypothetical protein